MGKLIIGVTALYLRTQMMLRRDQRMDVGRLLPLISLMYKVSISSFGGNASLREINTIIFEYDTKSGNVFLEDNGGASWVTPPPGTLCIFCEDQMHFQYVREKKQKWENTNPDTC